MNKKKAIFESLGNMIIGLLVVALIAYVFFLGPHSLYKKAFAAGNTLTQQTETNATSSSAEQDAAAVEAFRAAVDKLKETFVNAQASADSGCIISYAADVKDVNWAKGKIAFESTIGPNGKEAMQIIPINNDGLRDYDGAEVTEGLKSCVIDLKTSTVDETNFEISKSGSSAARDAVRYLNSRYSQGFYVNDGYLYKKSQQEACFINIPAGVGSWFDSLSRHPEKTIRVCGSGQSSGKLGGHEVTE